jgi:hypothetical protein
VRTAQCIWIAIFLSACAPFAQEQSHVVGSEKFDKLRSVYIKIKGPEEASGKLRESFSKTAARRELLLADDPHKAASVIDVTLKQKSGESTLYADLIAATLAVRDGDTSTVYSCKLVEDGKGFSTITKNKGKTGLIPGATKGTVFVEESTDQKSADLVATVKKEVGEAGFQISATEKDADITLKNIRLLKKAVRGTALETRVDSKVNGAGGRSINLVTNLTWYTAIKEPLGIEVEDCRSSIETIADHGSVSYQEVAEIDLALIGRPF